MNPLFYINVGRFNGLLSKVSFNKLVSIELFFNNPNRHNLSLNYNLNKKVSFITYLLNKIKN